ncbi:uncharacterized protein LOC118227471 [Anguilla anguilla]|uniref:uncharacterized protein LOC118227471 n=1 Tax=Anguilla anguilla TaxID=7936 RepID=UPI0015ACCCF8|nr:uncharacterized protein LOC118227471 [Anguilla anguilla]
MICVLQWKRQLCLATTTASPVISTSSPALPTTAAPRTVVGPVFIFVRLVFRTNNTIPSESDVLAKGSPFLNGDEIRLNDTVRVQNLTYERLTDNSFALRLAYKINDVSFPENVELRTETQARIQDSVNKLMNGLLIQPNASPFTFPQANFTHLPNEIRANVEYVYQEGDINQPSNFLAAILAVSGPTTTTASPVIATTNSPAVTTTAAPRTVYVSIFMFRFSVGVFLVKSFLCQICGLLDSNPNVISMCFCSLRILHTETSLQMMVLPQ